MTDQVSGTDLRDYTLPEENTVINFSGGRSSAFLLYHILDRYDGELPGNVRVAFANTGAEREETLVFVRECSERWNVPVAWLEYRHDLSARGGRKDPKHRHAIVSFKTASRNKEPFDALINAKRILPTVAMRFCTSEMKVNPVKWWLTRGLGWKSNFKNVLGIRYDEPKRWSKAIFEECLTEYPLVHAKVKVEDVTRFWNGHPFDLGIRSEQGNCDLCFLKGKGKLVRLIREEPGRAKWWIGTEAKSLLWERGLRNKYLAYFSKRFSYQDLLGESVSVKELPFEDTDEGISCFCGD